LAPSRPLAPGWNLIGYYGNMDDVPTGDPIFEFHGPMGNGAETGCALGSLVDTHVGMIRWSSLWTYWEPFNPDQWIGMNEWTNMDPGAGYWLEIDVNDLYAPSTTCPLLNLI